MRRGRVFFYLAVILILALVAVFVVWQKFLQPAANPSNPVSQVQPTPVNLVTAVVVTQKIPRGNVLDENVVGTIQMPKDLFIQGMFNNVSEVVGKRAKFDLESGIPLTSGMLVDTTEQLSSTGSNAALSSPRGMVSVSIPIDRLSSVSYAPQPGDHVNVIVTMLMVDLDTNFQSKTPNNTSAVIAPGPGVLVTSQTKDNVTTTLDKDITKVTAQSATGGVVAPFGRAELDPVLNSTFYVVPSEDQRPRMVSQTLLQDAVVLQIGTFSIEPETSTSVSPTPEAPQPTPAPSQTNARATQTPPITKGPDVISLIVSPQDAVTLNYLVYGGAKLTLALRAVGDDSRVQTEAVTLQFLLDQYRIPVPVKLPYGVEPRVDTLAGPTLENDKIVPTPQP
jgi:Flp pilus assembly protein CpaB